jgi:hypothetical protein
MTRQESVLGVQCRAVLGANWMEDSICCFRYLKRAIKTSPTDHLTVFNDNGEMESLATLCTVSI